MLYGKRAAVNQVMSIFKQAMLYGRHVRRESSNVYI